MPTHLAVRQPGSNVKGCFRAHAVTTEKEVVILMSDATTAGGGWDRRRWPVSRVIECFSAAGQNSIDGGWIDQDDLRRVCSKLLNCGLRIRQTRRDESVKRSRRAKRSHLPGLPSGTPWLWSDSRNHIAGCSSFRNRIRPAVRCNDSPRVFLSRFSLSGPSVRVVRNSKSVWFLSR